MRISFLLRLSNFKKNHRETKVRSRSIPTAVWEQT
jgi:hypothetical protein